MAISDIIKRLVSKGQKDKRFIQTVDSEGVNFVCDIDDFKKALIGHGSPWLVHQVACLSMMEEQGLAERLPNGYVVASQSLLVIDEDAKAILEMPSEFCGSFKSRVRGQTTRSSFSIELLPVRSDGQEEPVFRLEGPFLVFSSSERYLLTAAQYAALTAVEEHGALPIDEKLEAQNLQLVACLQQAKAAGMDIDLSHFETLEIHVPDKIALTGTQQADGSLLLTPSFGSGADPDQIHRRLGQLAGDDKAASLRVGDQVILLTEERLQAAHEIIENRYVPSSQVADFLESPGAFLDASLVDLDMGFSLRVKGASKFKYMPIGETDASGIEWFREAGAPKTPACIPSLVQSDEDLEELKKIIEQADSQGAGEVVFNGETIDISDKPAVEAALNGAEKRLREPAELIEEGPDDEKEEERATVELEEIDSDGVEKQFVQVEPFTGDIDLANLKRTPFPHQDEGIRWMLGLALQAHEADHSRVDRLQGGLLADDMGLGKTFMSLVALSEYYAHLKRLGQTQKPVLMVAPLSLLENWADEVDLTFNESPFTSIVTLQAGRQLKEFRLKGAKSETKQRVGEDEVLAEDAIRYSLKVGETYGDQRLDMPGRLVLTTYQTLRDYQFSLCLVDWSVVVFDEAQNIKSPNTLQTRAAKGLKADLKVLATGTPVENSLADFWCLMDTAQPGLLGSWGDFRNTYITPINKALAEDEFDVRLKVGEELRSAVGNLMLRRLKEDQLKGMPVKTIFTGVDSDQDLGWSFAPDIASRMVGRQLDCYDDVIKQYQTISDAGEAQGAALAALQKLREVSLHPNMSDESALLTGNAKQAIEVMSQSKKLESLLPLLNQIRSRNEKVIIFMMTKKLQRLMKVWLEQIYGISIDVINGDTKAVSNKKDALTRKGIIKRFESEPGFGVLIMSPVAAGVGLTVVGANNVIHLERHWNPAKEAQATDRVYRIGQEKEVNIYLPALHHPSTRSFDVNLDGLLSKKTNLKDAVVTPDVVKESDLLSSLTD